MLFVPDSSSVQLVYCIAEAAANGPAANVLPSAKSTPPCTCSRSGPEWLAEASKGKLNSSPSSSLWIHS